MYDQLETDMSLQKLKTLANEFTLAGIKYGIIGGWASYYYVNPTYIRAFGKDYMKSRDIDIFVDSSNELEVSHIIRRLGFESDGLPFRYQLIYNREVKNFQSEIESKKCEVYNLIYIFLDLFSNNPTTHINTWNDLPPLKNVNPYQIDNMSFVDIDTLAALKCTAIFSRDKADKENKDACDLYSILLYGNQVIKSNKLLIEAIKKILSRQDLIFMIAQQVLSDDSKRGIVVRALEGCLQKLELGSSIQNGN